MKNRDLLNLYNVLKKIEGRQFTVKFSYFVAKNKIALQNELEILDQVKKPSPDYIEYDTKRAKLAFEYADKTEQGKPRIENSNFIITERVDEFKTELDKLKEEYAKMIAEQDKKVKEFESVLDEDVKFDGVKVEMKDIPETIEPSILETFLQTNMIIEKE